MIRMYHALGLLLLAGSLGAAELRLADLLDEALAQHPAAEAIRLESGAARAQSWSSLSGALPQASYSAGFTRYESIGAGNLSSTSLREGDELQTHNLTLSQPLFSLSRFGGAVAGWHGMAIAREQERSRLAGFAYEVKAAYADWATARALMAVSQASLEFSLSQLERAEQQEELGSLSRIDRLFVENSKAQAEIALEQARLAEASARHELERILQRDLDPGTEAEPLLQLAAPRVNPAPELEELPSWRVLKRNRSRQAASAWAAAGNTLPTLNGFISWSNTGSAAYTYDSEYTNRTIGLSLSWTLFRSGGNLADGWAAWQSARSARHTLEAGTLELEASLKSLAERLESTQRQEELAQRSQEIARENLKLLEQKYELGLLDATDLLAGEQNLRAADSGLVQARAARLKAAWNLQQLKGEW